VLAAAPSTIPQSATHLPTSAVGTSSAPTPQRTAALPSTITSTKRSSFSSAGPTIAVEAAQQQDAAVPSSTTEASTSQGTIAQLKSTSSSRTTAHPQQQQQQQQKEERDQVEARLAAALVWCARQLAGRYKEMGDTEGEALAYLERHGVRCTAHYQNNSRFFSFPGCTSWLTKEALVPAIEEQKKAGCTPSSQAGTQLRNKRGRKRQSDAAGLHWCAQQLASSYDGLGGSKDEALAFLERKGVECAVNRGSLRLFRFPGCDRPVGKDRLARALGLQRKAVDPGREHLAAGLRWCAKQLVRDYQGVGDNQEQALAFLRDKGVVCSRNSNQLRLFCIPGCKDHLAAALGLQKKPELLEREQTQQRQQQEGMVWLAEKFCNVYQVGNLEPGKASVEDVLTELRKMGVQCVSVGYYPAMLGKGWTVSRTFSVPGKIERCNAKALAKALRLKLVPGCKGTSIKHSTSNSKTHEKGMLWLATKLLASPRCRHLLGETNDPQVVSKELASRGVWCSPSKKPSGYFNWRFRIKGRPGKVYFKDGVMRELFPEAFSEDEPEDDPE